MDLRDDEETLSRLSSRNLVPITEKQGKDLRKDLNAVAYVECSALKAENLDLIVSSIIGNPKYKKNKDKKKKTCSIV